MKRKSVTTPHHAADYVATFDDVRRLIDTARHASARTVNAVMTATYWLIGRHIVELEQKGTSRAEYGEQLLQRLANDLTARYGRGFSYPNHYHPIDP